MRETPDGDARTKSIPSVALNEVLDHSLQCDAMQRIGIWLARHESLQSIIIEPVPVEGDGGSVGREAPLAGSTADSA